MKHLSLLMLCCWLLWHTSHAQICTGSLGDPIVNIDFGTGPSFFSPNTFSNVTNYAYTRSQVEDGEYSIKKSTAGDHSGYNGWWQRGDHTGNGYMMVVNASYSPGEFFRQTVRGLCPGTTFEFAAWVLNLNSDNRQLKPNITFIIQTENGTKSFSTGNISNGDREFRQYGTYFKVPPGSGTVTIIMRNNAPGGGGNDLAIDDITFRPCGPIVTTRFNINGGRLVDAMEGDSLAYKMSCAPVVGYANPAYQWQTNISGRWQDIPGANNNNYQANIPDAASGVYSYRMVSAEEGSINSKLCRVMSNVISIKVKAPPLDQIKGPDIVCETGTIDLIAAPADTYAWTGPNNFKSDKREITIPNALTASSGTYKVTVTKGRSTALATHDVKVLPLAKASAGQPVSISTGNSVQLQATGGTIYKWSPAVGLSNPNIANPMASPTTTTKYKVWVSNGNNCYDTASVTVTVMPKLTTPTVTVPSSFKPVRNGIKETWLIKSISSYPTAEIRVYNREGINVFESIGYTKPWDGTANGKPLPPADYFYRIDLKNGEILRGYVTIVK